VAGDTFQGFEIVIGSRFDDILQGDFADNIMDGGRGADYMVGRDGADTFILHGNDTVYGGTNQYITDPEDDLIIIDGNASDYYIRSTSTYQVFEISRQVGDFTEVFQVGGVEHVQFSDGTQNLNWVPSFPF
jgi:Ca2+-binding RTX toxin-like protein